MAAADVAVLDVATNIALLAGIATVAEVTVIASASNFGTTPYAISDTSSAALAATVSVLITTRKSLEASPVNNEAIL